MNDWVKVCRTRDILENGGSCVKVGDRQIAIFNDGRGLITGIGNGRFGAAGTFPSIRDSGPANRYHSGSFSMTPNPEPGTLAMLGAVLTGAAVVIRRRRRRRLVDAPE